MRCYSPERVPDAQIIYLNHTQNMVNTSIRYECKRGFMISHGDQIRTCTETMEWTGIPPICQEIICPVLPRPDNCDITYRGFGFNSIVEYRCFFGYKFVNEVDPIFNRTCTANGQWDKYDPVCQRMQF